MVNDPNDWQLIVSFYIAELAVNDLHVKYYVRIEKSITRLTKYFAFLILLTCYAILLTPAVIICMKKFAGETLSQEDYDLPLKIMYEQI